MLELEEVPILEVSGLESLHSFYYLGIHDTNIWNLKCYKTWNYFSVSSPLQNFRF